MGTRRNNSTACTIHNKQGAAADQHAITQKADSHASTVEDTWMTCGVGCRHYPEQHVLQAGRAATVKPIMHTAYRVHTPGHTAAQGACPGCCVQHIGKAKHSDLHTLNPSHARTEAFPAEHIAAADNGTAGRCSQNASATHCVTGEHTTTRESPWRQQLPAGQTLTQACCRSPI